MGKERKIKKSEISRLPKETGIYFFYDKKGKLLYVGKATNLKDRVKSHFNKSNCRDNLFINSTKKIGCIPLSSEIEALILESQLIKKLQPKFNILFRDDKKYFYVGITKEVWPRVFLTHQTKIKNQNAKVKIDFIGPFTDGKALKETLKFLRKAFPYRSCKTIPKKSCFWYDLARCPAPCLLEKEKIIRQTLKKQTKGRQKEYKSNIKKLKEVLEGKRKIVLKELRKEMRKFSKKQEFEKAAKTRDKLEALESIFSHKIVLERLEAKQEKENEGEILKKVLSLSKIPKRIEGYDISNIKTKEMVGSMVVFKLNPENKKYLPEKKEYRLFKIKKIKKQNDIACLKEIISRRLNHKEWKMPDLIYVDGGKAQFNAVFKTLQQTTDDRRLANIPIISLAKRTKILYTNIFTTPIPLDPSPLPLVKGEGLDKLEKAAKMTILRLRDESHRFAISYHKKLRKKSVFGLS